MSYTETRRKIAAHTDEVMPKTHVEYVRQYYKEEFQEFMQNLENRYIYHLYTDLLESNTEGNFEEFLGGHYRQCDEYAQECVTIVHYAKQLYGFKIKLWTDTALKAFDYFLLQLIQQKLKENVRSSGSSSTLLERDVYNHLVQKGGHYADIGTAFNTIYQQRNTMTHVQYEDNDGKRAIKPLSRKQLSLMKDIILDAFKRALILLDKELA